MSSIFSPLANVLRPKSLNEVIGQEHLIGEGKPLRLMVQKKHFQSCILWGPPGIGKTTIVSAMAGDTGSLFHRLNATEATVKDLRKIIDIGREANIAGQRTIVFVDEIHRFSTSQQDVLLPVIEDGTLIMFGATTENPKFAVNSTILSRTLCLELKPLSSADIIALILRVKNHYRTYGKKINIDQDAIMLLINRCSGDARKVITVLETCVSVLSQDGNINVEHINSAIPNKHIIFNSKGQEHYDLAAAWQNCVQASDANGAIYWLCKWVASGEDVAFIARRMLITAFEDCATNLLAPSIAAAACYTAERTGMPECLIALGQATIVMCQSQRDKTGYNAVKQAMNDVENKATIHVPASMRAGVGGHAFAIQKQYVTTDVVEEFFKSFATSSQPKAIY